MNKTFWLLINNQNMIKIQQPMNEYGQDGRKRQRTDFQTQSYDIRATPCAAEQLVEYRELIQWQVAENTKFMNEMRMNLAETKKIYDKITEERIKFESVANQNIVDEQEPSIKCVMDRYEKKPYDYFS